MISYSMRQSHPWDCGQIIRRLREEQKAIAIGFKVSAHHQLQAVFYRSGLMRTWVSDGRVMAMMGVTGPPLATEGEIWAAISEEATKYPIQIVKQARRSLLEILMLKHRLTASPYKSDPASIRFARNLGFIEAADQTFAETIGAVAMVLSLNVEAYIERRIERQN